MKQLPKRINHRLNRQPDELLEVVRHQYQDELGSNVHAAFPVNLRQSLQLTLMRFGALGGIAWVITFLALDKELALVAGIVTAFTSLVLTNEKTPGIVAVTDQDFALIKLDKKATFISGKVIERIDVVSNRLTEPRPMKGSGVDCHVLPFTQEGHLSWYYAFLTDHGGRYLTLIEELRLFQKEAAMETAAMETAATG